MSKKVIDGATAIDDDRSSKNVQDHRQQELKLRKSMVVSRDYYSNHISAKYRQDLQGEDVLDRGRHMCCIFCNSREC